jgi:hypothetical protein
MPRQARLDAAATPASRHHSGNREERSGSKGVCFTVGQISKRDGHIHLCLGAHDEPRPHTAEQWTGRLGEIDAPFSHRIRVLPETLQKELIEAALAKVREELLGQMVRLPNSAFRGRR